MLQIATPAVFEGTGTLNGLETSLVQEIENVVNVELDVLEI